eukprot:g997.t1
MSSNLMDLMNADFSDEDSADEEDSQKLFEKYGRVFPIHAVCEAGDAEAIAPVLQKSGNLDFNPEEDELVEDVSIDQRDHDDCTPLHVSILKQHIDCVKTCLEKGARTEGSAGMLLGAHPLHLAIMASARDDDKGIAFAESATRILLETMKRRQKVKTETTDIDVFALKDAVGRTPLHIAAQFAATNCASALIAAAGSKDAARRLLLARDHRGRTALHMACERAHRVHDTKRALSFLRTMLMTTAAAAGEQSARDLADARDERGATALDTILARASSPISSEATTMLKKFASSATSSSASPPVEALRVRAAAALSSPGSSTLVMTHSACTQHLTCPQAVVSRKTKDVPPPENVRRLKVLCDDSTGALRASEFRSLQWKTCSKASMADIVRVHEYAYVAAIKTMCAAMDGVEKSSKTETRTLDRDATISRESYNAALFAAGGAIDAVNAVVSGTHRNAFCAIRPPGHHAGPRGKVASIYDQCGSHGFCLFNNVAVAAAYARTGLRDDVRRVAILDFDVHHGNGTEAILRNLKPSVRCVPCRGPQVAPGLQMSKETNAVEVGLRTLEASAVSFKPWKNDDDVSDVFFASTHGYGKLADGSHMFPGSGATCGVALKANCVTNGRNPRELYGLAADEDPAAALSSVPWENTESLRCSVKGAIRCRSSGCRSGHLNGRFDPVWDDRIINCGMARSVRLQWRLTWVEQIFPALYKFSPDLILISAGFDAHFQDDLNHGFVGLVADDYAWLTKRIVQFANGRCKGRVVSLLEGGYRIQGESTSPFARSVAAHVRALDETSPDDVWTPTSKLATWESAHLRRLIAESKARSGAGNARVPSASSSGASNGGAIRSRPAAAAEQQPRPKRRRRAAVDYAKLNAALEKEKGNAK